jgi:Zn finger protein HypA/HybF involved in hydrogenase expression
MVAFGICPNGDCKLSYGCAAELESWYVAWNSERNVPTRGWPSTGRADMPQHLMRIFQVAGRHCTNCGVELVINVELPNLGKCSGESCGRSYTEHDFGCTFCPQCGSPTDIPGNTQERYSRQVQIRRVLNLIPRLQKDGLLPL